MPDEWKLSVVVSIFKGTGGIINCGSYWRVKLVEGVLKKKHSFYYVRFFKLKVALILATSNQWKPWCIARILFFNTSSN